MTNSQQPRYNQVLIFCPEVVTGGPEALHQLAHSISGEGGMARLVYTGPGSHMHIDGSTVVCHLDPKSPPFEAFRKYTPKILDHAVMDGNTLAIYPEIMIRHVKAQVEPLHTRAIWWLSVNSAFHSNPELNDARYREDFFADHTIIHFYQSAYARDFLREQKASNYYPLFDYTDQDFINHRNIGSDFVANQNRINSVAYFPRKGGELANRLFASSLWNGVDIKFVPIENMSKSEVRRTLFSTKIYVDFGQHPGKDRVPREASIAGAILLLHDLGAAQNFEDYPIDSWYKFTIDDVQSERIGRKIQEILRSPEEHYNNQKSYRQRIFLEKEEFDLQIRRLFFDHEPAQ